MWAAHVLEYFSDVHDAGSTLSFRYCAAAWISFCGSYVHPVTVLFVDHLLESAGLEVDVVGVDVSVHILNNE